jgi:hypothetical protein
MEAASISETSVNFYQATRLYNPEDSHLLDQGSFVVLISKKLFTFSPFHATGFLA